MKKKLHVFAILFVAYTPSFTQTNHTIGLAGDVFTPSTLTINQGDMVTWSNNDTDAHTSTSGQNCTSDGLWNSGTINAGESFSRTFNTPGTFPYFCQFHCQFGMVGTITVNAVNGVIPNALLKLDLKGFPNPFTEKIEIEFEIQQQGQVTLDVYNLLGKQVWSSGEVTLNSGKQSMIVEGENLAEGNYICKVFCNGYMAGARYIQKSVR